MGVRIDKSRQHHAAANINFSAVRASRPAFPFLRVGPTAAIIPSRTSSAPSLMMPRLRKGIAAPRTAAAQRQELRCARDEKGIRQGPVIMPNNRAFALPATRHLFQASAVFGVIQSRQQKLPSRPGSRLTSAWNYFLLSAAASGSNRPSFARICHFCHQRSRLAGNAHLLQRLTPPDQLGKSDVRDSAFPMAAPIDRGYFVK